MACGLHVRWTRIEEFESAYDIYDFTLTLFQGLVVQITASYRYCFVFFIWIIIPLSAWWRHQMETFSALLAIFAGNSPVSGEFPAQRPVTRSFDIFFDLHLNKRLSKQAGDLRCYRAHYDVSVMGSMWLIFVHIMQTGITVTGATAQLPRHPWNNPKEYGQSWPI